MGKPLPIRMVDLIAKWRQEADRLDEVAETAVYSFVDDATSAQLRGCAEELERVALFGEEVSDFVT